MSLLFGGERLPSGAAAGEPPRPAGRGWPSLLFGREHLPLDPVAPRPRRAPWLRWLFVPERLDAEPSGPEVE